MATPLNLTLPPPRSLNSHGDFSDMNLVSTALQQVEDAFNDLIAEVARKLDGRVSATEPAHDGSQVDGELWVKPT